MPEQHEPDPRSRLAYSVRAMRGLRDLIIEAGRHQSNDFELVQPSDLGELFEVAFAGIESAADELELYQPPK